MKWNSFNFTNLWTHILGIWRDGTAM